MTTTPPMLDYQSPIATIRPTRPFPIVEAVAHIVFGVILPIICFAMSANGYPGVDQPWQSGDARMYVSQIPRASCAWPFYPFLLYAMASLAITVIAPRLALERFPLRLGIYTGIILALQFMVVQVICVGDNGVFFAMLIAAALVPFGLYELLRWLMRRFERGMRLVGATLAAVAVVVLLGMLLVRRLHFLFMPGLFVLIAAPGLTLASYLSVARVLLTYGGEKKRGWWLWAPWLGGYSAAWWGSVVFMLDAYSKLPKAAPSGCYVVTAAAGGHPWLVGSKRIVRDDGSVAVINAQLHRLKLAELFIAAAFPRVHRGLRSVYDRVGPPMARCVGVHPVLCDLAYCSLKPVEWAVAVLLTMLGPIQHD